MNDRPFNRLHVYAKSMFLAGAGLAFMTFGSAALAQNAVNGKELYTLRGCLSCHLDPNLNRDGVLAGANDPQRILAECATEPEMIAFCSQDRGFAKVSLADAVDIAAYLANPNELGAAISVDKQALAFRRAIGNGASGRQTVTVTNTGDANLVLTTVALTGNGAADFAQLAPAAGVQCVSGLSIAAQASCKVDITFDPSVAAARTANLVFTPDGLDAATVVLNGTGTAAAEPFAVSDVAALNFGNQVLNATTATKTVVVTNNGDANLTFDAANAFALAGTNPDEYAVDAGGTCQAGGNVAAGGSTCTVLVKFTPKAAGNRAATLTVNSNGENLTVNLAGNGVAADNNEGEAGCSTINPNAAFDPMLLSLLAAALAVMGLRRRQR